jgi:hypothetical protein
LKATAEGIQFWGSEDKIAIIDGKEIEVPAAIEIEEGMPKLQVD